MLAFGTLFSCQGAASSAKPKRLEYPTDTPATVMDAAWSFLGNSNVTASGHAHTRCFNVRRAGDTTAAPIQMTNPAWRDSRAPPAGGWPRR
jgi:hypothetical protein